MKILNVFACVWIALKTSAFVFFSIFFFTRFLDLRLLFMYCSMNNSHKLWLFYFFQPISAHRALFIDPQISLFSNFFIKNESHGTIYIFKNYFATVFFSFQLYPNGPLLSKIGFREPIEDALRAYPTEELNIKSSLF